MKRLKLILVLLLLSLFLAPVANAVVTGREIVQSYERIMDGHLSRLAPEKRRELSRQWLAPGADPLKAGDSASDMQLSAALGVMSQAAATLDEGERATLPEKLRASLQRILKQLDGSEQKDEVVGQRERGVVSRPFLSIYRSVPHISALTLSDDGRWIAFGELKARTLTILDFQTQAPVKTLRFKHAPTFLRFSPDGRFLAVSFRVAGCGGFEIFETTGWKSVLRDMDGGDRAPVFLKGSDRVVEWGRRRNRIFSLTSKKANRSPPQLADLFFTDQVIAPDGSWFAGVDHESKRIEVFSSTGERLRDFLPGADVEYNFVYMAAPEGKTLIRVYENSVDFHDVASGRFLSKHSLGLKDEAQGMVLDRQGKLLFVSESVGNVQVYRIEPGKTGPEIHPFKTLQLPRDPRMAPEDLILTPDEKRLIVRTSEKIVMFDLEAGRLLGEFE